MRLAARMFLLDVPIMSEFTQKQLHVLGNLCTVHDESGIFISLFAGGLTEVQSTSVL